MIRFPLGIGRLGSPWSGRLLKILQKSHSFVAIGATHFGLRPQALAEGRSFGPTKERAKVFPSEMEAADPGRFSVRHPGHGCRDGGGDAAGAAAHATIVHLQGIHGTPLMKLDVQFR